MTQDEIKLVLATIKVAYPNSFTKLTVNDLRIMVTLWERQFKDSDKDLVAKALDSYIATDTTGFMPSIGKIKEIMYKLSAPKTMNESEAWNIVKKALSNSSYHSEREFEQLPPQIQRLVGSPNTLREWAITDLDELNTVISSNFMRSYRNLVQVEKEEMLLTGSVAPQIESDVVKNLALDMKF